MAGSVYNWGPSSALLNTLHAILNPDGRRYRAFMLIMGAGSPRSHLAYTSLSATIVHELHAIMCGPPILIAGQDADMERGQLSPEIKNRIEYACAALLCVAEATAAKYAPSIACCSQSSGCGSAI